MSSARLRLVARHRPAPVIAEDVWVMIVDDDLAVAQSTALLLRSLGVDSVLAAGTEMALEMLSDGDLSPDVLICDYHLGLTETGVDAIRAIRESLGRKLPAIVVSGDTTHLVTHALQGLERCHLLSKPVDSDDLLALCARLAAEDGAIDD